MNRTSPYSDPEHVILVNERDEVLGSMEKLEAHLTGSLHRAFSVFLFDKGGRMLLQQRALGKYHSPGLWTNTCCSHPRPSESILDAANRRLKEEMGLEASLEQHFSFIYRAAVGQGLIEHELDHVLIGQVEGDPLPDPKEVMDFRFVDPSELEVAMRAEPANYTVWLRTCWPQVAALLDAKRA